jgi:hypothetical protein
MFCRKNSVLTCISSREYALDIKDTCGTVEIPLVNREEISAKIAKLSPEVRKTISYIHIGSIRIMIKATLTNSRGDVVVPENVKSYPTSFSIKTL